MKKILKLNDLPLGKADWLIYFIMAAFIWATMLYEDMIVIHHHSLTFLDSLFSLDLANFYGNTLASPSFGCGAVYYWIVYAVIGIWNLPFWLLKFVGVDPEGVAALLWAKLQMVFFLMLAMRMIEKILADCGFGKDRCRFAQFMLASSMMVVLPSISIAQIDIITVFFILWGIREYISNEQITWKFLLIFSFAAAMKIFALFIFIPLVVLKEKRILYVVRDWLLGTVFIIISLAPYAWREDYIESTSMLNDKMINRMYERCFTGGNAAIPAFPAILIAISVWAYITHVKGKKETLRYANWIGLAVYSTFLIYIYSYPYWMVLAAPYLAMMLVIEEDHLKANLILEFVVSVGLSVYYCGFYAVYIAGNTFSYLILPLLGFYPPNDGTYSSLNGAISRRGLLSYYFSIVFAAFAVCVLAMLIYNRPWRKTAEDIRADMAGDGSESAGDAMLSGDTKVVHSDGRLRFDHGMIYMRLFMILWIIVATIYYSYF